MSQSRESRPRHAEAAPQDPFAADHPKHNEHKVGGLLAAMKDLTVLASQNDPFRVDTPARHRDGAWLAKVAP
jgi:hypothetical protein